MLGLALVSTLKKLKLKEIKDLNKWEDSLCSWIEIFNTVKTALLLRLIYRLNAIPMKKKKINKYLKEYHVIDESDVIL